MVKLTITLDVEDGNPEVLNLVKLIRRIVKPVEETPKEPVKEEPKPEPNSNQTAQS